jgi:hypothetical protein
MFMVEAFLATLIFAPFILTVLLKSSGTWLFFSACVGVVLVNYVADGFISSMGFWVRGSFDSQNISLALLLLPSLLTILLSLLIAWLTAPKHKPDKKHKKH